MPFRPLFRNFSKKFSSRSGGDSHVARGRRYEEASQVMLRSIGISVRCVGGSSDGGVDLVGSWHFNGDGNLDKPLAVPIIAQCKHITRLCPPAVVRELEGTLARETSSSVALLVSSSPASPACIESIIQSSFPLLFLHYDMVKLRRAFGNIALQRKLPRLIIGSKHVAGEVEPAFFLSD